MFTISALYADQALRLANERIGVLHREAEHSRVVSAPRRSIFQRLIVPIARARGMIASRDPHLRARLPKLTDYPSRS